jgi:GR25 family glycosyltransferase involved in LPS biosynthesis
MVINLAARTDRLTAFAQEMEKLGIEDAQRFDAVSDENAALGCSLSHVGCIQQMVECGWQSVMVCEDDVGFRVSRRELDVLVDQFLDDADADVACLAYFVRRSRPHNALYLRGTVIQTAACYLVKRRVAEELIDIWLAGIEQLRRGGSRNRYILDKAWVPLQSKRVFLVPVVRAAGQRESYSDLQGRVVSYSH